MAGTAIPNFMVGRNVAAAYGADLYINSAGNLVSGNTVDYHALGILDLFEYTVNNGNVEISALDAAAENNLPTKVSFEFSVGEIKQPGGSSKLQNVSFNQSTLFGFEAYVVDPSSGAGSVLVMIGRIVSARDAYMQGKNVFQINCATAGILPYYSTFGGGGSTAAQSSGISSGNIRVGRAVTSSQ